VINFPAASGWGIFLGISFYCYINVGESGFLLGFIQKKFIRTFDLTSFALNGVAHDLFD